MPKTKVQIVGGHGKVALILARQLVDKGYEVHSLIRNKAHEDDVRNTGAHATIFDAEHAKVADFEHQFKGSDVVVWSAGAGGGDERRTYAVDRDAAIRSIEGAKAAHVKRYLLVSYLGANLNHNVPKGDSFHAYATAKAEADDYLRKAKINYTIIAPGSLTLQPGSGRISVNPSETGNRDTSRENVASVIAAAIETPSTERKEIPFIDGDTPLQEAVANL